MHIRCRFIREAKLVDEVAREPGVSSFIANLIVRCKLFYVRSPTDWRFYRAERRETRVKVGPYEYAVDVLDHLKCHPAFNMLVHILKLKDLATQMIREFLDGLFGQDECRTRIAKDRKKIARGLIFGRQIMFG